MLTQPQIKELFEYKDGKLFWKVKKGRANAGDEAGTKGQCNGIAYKKIKLNQRITYIHRLVFLYHHGYLPAYVDHIDGDSLNNRIENLREADQSKNSHNARLKSSNTSGAKNVYWNKQRRKWMVQIKLIDRQAYFGLYDDFELAQLVAIEAREKFCGAFARHI